MGRASLFSCPFCGEPFADLSTAQSHVLERHDNLVRTFLFFSHLPRVAHFCKWQGSEQLSIAVASLFQQSESQVFLICLLALSFLCSNVSHVLQDERADRLMDAAAMNAFGEEALSDSDSDVEVSHLSQVVV